MIITTPLLKWYDFPGDTAALILDSVKTANVAGGWTNTTFQAFQTGTFTGLPADGQTITIDTIVYTAKNTPVGGNDYQIGADATATAANLATKINATHTTVTASSAAGVLTVTAVAAGPAGNGLSLSEASTNFTWAISQTEKGGYKLDTGINPDGLQCRLYAYGLPSVSATTAYFRFMSVDETAAQLEADRFSLTAVASRRYRIRVTNYDLEEYLPSVKLGSEIHFAGGVPWLPADMVGAAVSNVTNSGGLIKVTTTAAHKRVSGDVVFISGVIGVTIAPNPGNITVIDTTNFTINGSTFSGAYVSGGRVGGSFTDTTVSPPIIRKQLSRVIWGIQPSGATFSAYPRGGPKPSPQNGESFVCENETYLSGNVGGGSPQAPFFIDGNKRFVDAHYYNYAALLEFNRNNLGTEVDESGIGGIYQAFYNTKNSLTLDTEGNLPLPGGEHFFVYGEGTSGCVCLLVPATPTVL